MLDVTVAKRLGAFEINAEFTCATQGIVALFGRSGAGKTSLVNMLAGLSRPDSGRIEIEGVTVFDSSHGLDLRPEHRRIGYVFQEGRLFPHMTVRGNLTYGLRRAPAHDRRIQLDQIVELLGLETLLGRRPHDLSGGEKQRVALGRALLANPRLLLMDEPLAGLDQPRTDEVLRFIERLRDELTIPIVYVSHAMQEIVRLADTMVLMSGGRVEAVGPLDDLTSRLDLRPLTGRYEAGAVLEARVEGQDAAFALTELSFAGGHLWVPRLDLPRGAELRLRIRARDVVLAHTRPEGTSILNAFPCVVKDIGAEGGAEGGTDLGAQVDLRLDAGGAALWARITRRSLHELALAPGSEVYALIKAVAIDRYSLGRSAGTGRFFPDAE